MQTIARKYKHHGTMQPAYHSGRRRVLSPKDECTLVRKVQINPRTTAKVLVKMLEETGTNVSISGGLGYRRQRSGLRREILGSSPGSVTAGQDREVHGATHNWPSIVRVRDSLTGRDILVSSRTSDPCGGPGAVRANQVARCTVFPPTHWCGWLPGWMALC